MSTPSRPTGQSPPQYPHPSPSNRQIKMLITIHTTALRLLRNHSKRKRSLWPSASMAETVRPTSTHPPQSPPRRRSHFNKWNLSLPPLLQRRCRGLRNLHYYAYVQALLNPLPLPAQPRTFLPSGWTWAPTHWGNRSRHCRRCCWCWGSLGTRRRCQRPQRQTPWRCRGAGPLGHCQRRSSARWWSRPRQACPPERLKTAESSWGTWGKVTNCQWNGR